MEGRYEGHRLFPGLLLEIPSFKISFSACHSAFPRPSYSYPFFKPSASFRRLLELLTKNQGAQHE
jgi:hypothetical protein